MTYKPDKHHRRSIRLKGYDYAQAGAYFVTICTQGRACLFGDILDGHMRLNECGGIVAWTWQDLPNHAPNVALDAFVLMPNHVHGIIVITDTVGAGSEPAPTTEPAPTEPTPANTKRYALPEIVRQFKTFSARRINKCRGTPGVAVWQRNYYEHILRSEESLNRVRQYILNNPHRWTYDRQNPAATTLEPEDAWAQ
jgi:REP element-mobilizing transposase RayT